MAQMIPTVFLVSALLLGAEISVEQRSSLPRWARAAYERSGLSAKSAISSHLNPFYQRGDFDGDGKPDLAVVVRERESGKIGVLFVRRSSKMCEVVGAGRLLDAGGDDWSWLDAWSVYDRG